MIRSEQPESCSQLEVHENAVIAVVLTGVFDARNGWFSPLSGLLYGLRTPALHNLQALQQGRAV